MITLDLILSQPSYRNCHVHDCNRCFGGFTLFRAHIWDAIMEWDAIASEILFQYRILAVFPLLLLL